LIPRPEPHSFEETEPRALPNSGAIKHVFGSEENGAGKDPFEASDKAPVVGTIRRESEFAKDFCARRKRNLSRLLPHRSRRDPQWNQSILAKGESVLWVAADLKDEVPVPPSVNKRSCRRLL
jgi:hypothetical protein